MKHPRHRPKSPETPSGPPRFRRSRQFAAAGERAEASVRGLAGGIGSDPAQVQARLEALEARVRAAIVAGNEVEDAEKFEREVREELAPFMGEERVNRYFDMFPAQTDWAGVAFYVKRNP